MILLFTIAIAGIAIGLFTLLLVLSKGKQERKRMVFTAWLATLTINQIYFALVGIENFFLESGLGFGINIDSLFQLTGMGMVLVHSPLLYIFTNNFSKPSALKTAWVHLLPFAIYLIGFTFLSHNCPDCIYFKSGFIWFNKPIFPFTLYGLFFAAVAGTYTILALLSMISLRKKLSENHSGEIRNVLNWLQIWIVAAVIFFVLTYLTIEFFISVESANLSLTFGVVSSFLTVYIAYISFWSLKKPEIFRVKLFPEVSDKESSFDEKEAKELTATIKKVLSEEKLYLDPDLSLSKLSDACNISAGKVSKLINREMDTNFYDLINDYRVEEFKERLRNGEDKNLSIIGLAYDCGFRSKSTFYAFFKKKTGQSPTAFKKNLEKVSG